MTIQELKNHVALKLGYVGWHEIIDDHKLSDEIVDILLTEQLSKLGVSGKENLIAFLEWYWREVDGKPYDTTARDIVDSY